MKISDIIMNREKYFTKLRMSIYIYFICCLLILSSLLFTEKTTGEFPVGLCYFVPYTVFLIVLWILAIECIKDNSTSGFMLSINYMTLAFIGPLFLVIIRPIMDFCITISSIYFSWLILISITSFYFSVQDRKAINIILSCMCLLITFGFTSYFVYYVFIN